MGDSTMLPDSAAGRACGRNRVRAKTWARILGTTALAVIAVLGLGGSAGATVSGTNGPIAFERSITCPTNTNLGGSQIYTINADGTGAGNRSQSVCSGYSDASPAVSPDGSKIAFVRSPVDGLSQVFVMNADGSNQTQLSNGLFDDSGPLAWSPTGSKIAFIRGDSIWTMNADGSNATEVPNTSGGYFYYGIAWSPDATRLAFVRYESYYGEADIYTISPTGSNLTDVTYGSGYDSYGASDWSPDGTKILTTRYTGSCGGYEDVWTINANGSGGTDLTCGDTNYKYHAVWSPDGSKIAFYRNGTIYTMSASGGNQTALVSGYNPSWGTPPPPPPPSAPGAVTNLSSSYSSGTVTVSWTNPTATSTTGTPTGDVVRRSSTDGTCPTSTTDGTGVGGTGLRTSQTDSGLPNGTYCYAVFATNSAGAGPRANTPVTVGSTIGTPGVPQYKFYTPSALPSGSSPTVPELTTWSASSTTGVTYTLEEQVNGGAWTVVLSGTTALQFKTQLAFNSTYAFQVKAVKNGSSSAYATNTTFTVLPYQETALTYTGTWTTTTNTNQWGGGGRYTKVAGASGSLSFTGRNVALIGNKGTGNGSAKMYIDGVLKSTVSENASSTKYRQLIAKFGWSTPGAHTIKFVNVATSGHPRFDIDGIVVFQ